MSHPQGEEVKLRVREGLNRETMQRCRTLEKGCRIQRNLSIDSWKVTVVEEDEEH